MTDACQYLHHTLSRLRRLSREDLAQVPGNGIYVLFEKGEEGHGVERIVRIGTHTGQNNLALRIREHLYTPNKDRSIFRKHVGRCLLAKKCDPFLTHWQIDLTTKASRTMNGHTVDKAKLKEVEDEVTRHMTENFSFSTLRFDTPAERLRYEESLLSTIFHCRDCGPSEAWLGKAHPTSAVMRGCGLWNVQGLRGPVLSLDEALRVIELGTKAAARRTGTSPRAKEQVAGGPRAWSNSLGPPALATGGEGSRLACLYSLDFFHILLFGSRYNHRVARTRKGSTSTSV